MASIFSDRQFLASVSSSVSCRLSNRDDIFEQFDVIISPKTQMAEYVTETKGIPGKNGKYFMQINTLIFIFSVFLPVITRGIDIVVFSRINSNDV